MFVCAHPPGKTTVYQNIVIFTKEKWKKLFTG